MLRNAQGTHWIQIPLFGQPTGARFHSIEIETGGRWREKHWRSFLYDYRTTMYFDFYKERFRPFFTQEWTQLSQCLCRSVELQASLYGATTTVTRASNLSGAPTTVPGIMAAVGEGPLVLPADRSDQETESFDVVRFEYDHPTYHQNFQGFQEGVTAMDLLFNYGREAPRLLMKGIRVTNLDE